MCDFDGEGPTASNISLLFEESNIVKEFSRLFL